MTMRAPECEDWVGAAVDPDSLIAESLEPDNGQLACQDLVRR